MPLNNGQPDNVPIGATIPAGSVPSPWPGHDELSRALFNGNFYQGQYMADDFCDYQSSPIVHVVWWGSYMTNSAPGPVLRFLIAFENDVPANAPGNELGYSHPGSNIVSQIVTLGPLAPFSGTFTETPVVIPPGPPSPDGNLYRYNAELAIPVTELSNQVKWIKIVALIDQPQGNVLWGWHNRDYGIRDPLACIAPGVVPGETNLSPIIPQPIWHFQDDAVTGPITIGPGPLGTNVLQAAYFPTFYVQQYDGIPPTFSKDLAFALYTRDLCGASSTNLPTKWLEPPNLINGLTVFDTSPKVLGDDFQCTLTGPITDIHLWGAWLFDQIGVVTNFRVAFFSDVPATQDTYSRPGNELWSTNFLASQYTQQIYTNAPEQFYNPNTDTIMGPDSILFRYNFCIDPAKAFVQTNGVIYWLVVQAQTVNGVFGWKSSTAHCHDDAVWGDTPGPIWNELRYPGGPLQGQSFDLAFELTTPIPFNIWQLQYFGCTNCSQAAGGFDFDGDGVSNTNEFLSGTVPTNSASVFRVISIVRQNTNNVNLTWTTVGGHSYVVQTNSPLPGGSYTNNFANLSLLFNVLGTGPSSTNYVHLGGATNSPSLFYRVILGPPPCE